VLGGDLGPKIRVFCPAIGVVNTTMTVEVVDDTMDDTVVLCLFCEM